MVVGCVENCSPDVSSHALEHHDSLLNMIQQAINKYFNTVLSSTESNDRKFKAVLFDMDGVLYDSMPHHAVAWQKAMAQFGLTMTAADAYATEGARGIDTIRSLVKKQRGKQSPKKRHNASTM